MPRGTAPAQRTTNAAAIPALYPLPSIEPGQTKSYFWSQQHCGRAHVRMDPRICAPLVFPDHKGVRPQPHDTNGPWAQF